MNTTDPIRVVSASSKAKHPIFEFNGVRYHRNQKGYYCRFFDGRTLRLHREVWRAANGEIPDTHDIHHKNEDKADNRLENLECKPRVDHLSEHCRQDAAAHADGLARRRAAAAHVERSCRECRGPYRVLEVDAHKSLFCSTRCKNRSRRKSGAEDEKTTCPICAVEFVRNRYKGPETCSSVCAQELRRARRTSASGGG